MAGSPRALRIEGWSRSAHNACSACLRRLGFDSSGFESGDTLDEGAAEELSSIATSDGDRNTLPQGHGPEHDGESRLQWRLEEAGRVSCGPWLEDGT